MYIFMTHYGSHGQDHFRVIVFSASRNAQGKSRQKVMALEIFGKAAVEIMQIEMWQYLSRDFRSQELKRES